MIVQISKTDKKEIKKVVEIYNSYPECFEFEISEEFLNFSLMNKNFYLFAFKDKDNEKEIYGFCGIYFYNSEICEIGPIGVDKKFLNKKISTCLLSYTLSFAKNLKVKECFVKVKRENLRAIKFFSNFSFSKLYEDEKIVIMNKLIQ